MQGLGYNTFMSKPIFSDDGARQNALAVLDPNPVNDREEDEEWITQKQIREKLGISANDFKRLAQVGVIKASTKRNNTGHYLYSRKDFEKLKEKIKSVNWHFSKDSKIEQRLPPSYASDKVVAYTAEEGKKIVTLLRENRKLDEIFIETGIHPAIIMTVVRDFATLCKGLFLTPAIVDKINELPLEGNFPIDNDKDLYDA